VKTLALIDQSKPGSEKEPTNIQRRTVIGGALLALLASPGRVMAQGKAVPDDAFDVLLKGLYQPVPPGTGPNLGLSTVNVSDGTYSTTKIYPVNGIPGSDDALTAVGDFYVQFGGSLCAYDLPGGALSMQFLPQNNTTTFPDGQGGKILQGTWELTVLEATGAFRGFVRGHNHMLDNLHFLAPGDGTGGIYEYCVCFVSRRPKA
jgi:hypothetical protein